MNDEPQLEVVELSLAEIEAAEADLELLGLVEASIEEEVDEASAQPDDAVAPEGQSRFVAIGFSGCATGCTSTFTVPIAAPSYRARFRFARLDTPPYWDRYSNFVEFSRSYYPPSRIAIRVPTILRGTQQIYAYWVASGVSSSYWNVRRVHC